MNSSGHWVSCNLAHNDVDPRLRKQHLVVALSKVPGLRNLMSLTVPMAHRMEDRRELKDTERFDRYLRNEELNSLAEGYYKKGVGSESSIDKFIGGFEENHIRTALNKRRKFIEDTINLPHYRSWITMFHTTPETKAKDYFDVWKVMPEEERGSLNVELDDLLDAGYVGEGSRDRFFGTLDDLKNEYYRLGVRD